MKVLLISLYFVEYVLELANALSKLHHVHLVVSEKRINHTIKDQFYRRLSSGIGLTLLPLRSNRYASILALVYRVVKLYLSFKPDVVHLQEGGHRMNLLFLLIGMKKCVVTVHDVELHPGRQQRRLGPTRKAGLSLLRRYLYRRVILHGEKLKEKFIHQYHRSPHDVFVVPHGNFNIYLPDGSDRTAEDANTILFFGRMDHYKGLPYLIEAAPIIQKKVKNLKIIVAGHGDDLDKYQHMLTANAQFEIHNRFIANEEIPAFFKRSALIVIPYIEASQSGIVAMAFAFGKPVVATDVGSIGEVVKNGRNGLLVPPKNSESLAEAVILLLRNEEMRKKMGREALATANKQLSWAKIAGLTSVAYHSVHNKGLYN